MNIRVENKYSYRGSGENIMRRSPLGNPFVIGENKNGSREDVCKMYRIWLWRQIKDGNQEVITELNRLLDLAIKQDELVLLCCCKPKQCHGDTIKSCLMWMAVYNTLN